MKKHFLSITLLLAPASLFAMDEAEMADDIVHQLIEAAPSASKKATSRKKKGAVKTVQDEAETEEVQPEETVVQQLATAAAAPATQAATPAAEEEKDSKDSREAVEAAYRRGFLGSVGLKVLGYDRTTYVKSYFRCNERCTGPCEHEITIPTNMIDQLNSDRNRAIMKEQTEVIKGLQAKSDGTIPSQHEVQKAIHEGPVQALGTIVRGSKQSVNFQLKDVRSVKRVDTLLRNEDAADLQFLADAYNLVQTRMQERKAMRKDLYTQKPTESDIVYSDTEYGDDEQFVAKLQGYRKAKKAVVKK